MLMLVLRPRDFSWITSCSLMSFAVFVASILVSSSSLDVRAQSASPTSLSSQAVPVRQKMAAGKMAFEVAAIHPAAPGTHPHSGTLGLESSTAPPGGRVSVIAPLSFYIQFAYKLMLLSERQNDSVFGHVPKWVTTELFDIEAQAPTTDVTPDQIRLMMQSLLADRFKLVAHYETHEVPVLALVQVNPGKLGPRIRPHSEGPPCDAKISPVDRNSPKIPDVWIPFCGSTQNVDWKNNTVILGSRNTTMDILAAYIPGLEPLDRPVVNQTGLEGGFDIEVNFTPPWKMPKAQNADAQLDTSGPTFLEAIKDQLGLKLITTHAPVQTLVIDHVEQPSPN